MNDCIFHQKLNSTLGGLSAATTKVLLLCPYNQNYCQIKSKSLVLQVANGTANDGQDSAQRNQHQSQNAAGRQTDEGNLDSAREQVRVQTGGAGSAQEESRGSDVQGAGHQGEEEGSALHGHGGEAVDQELLVVSDEGEDAEFLEEGEELLGLLKGESLLFELGEDAELGGLFEEAQFADSGEKRVLPVKHVIGVDAIDPFLIVGLSQNDLGRIFDLILSEVESEVLVQFGARSRRGRCRKAGVGREGGRAGGEGDR